MDPSWVRFFLIKRKCLFSPIPMDGCDVLGINGWVDVYHTWMVWVWKNMSIFQDFQSVEKT